MKKFLTILLSCVMLLFIVTSCNSNNQFKTPQEALENVYGNQEYKISFMSEGLSVPLDSMNYTANNMPKLPVPEKIGYIFSGWYLDEKLTIPYTDGILYLYMKDVTLYPKWEKESFLANGKYDIEYEANIIEDSVVKGLKTDDYGGYIDFTECLVKDEIYLEKSDDKFLLKLQYDTKVTIPMFTNAGDVFTVKISSLMDSSIVISDRINSLADPKKTVFIDLTNFSLEDTLYLDIQTTNWFTDGLSDSSRLETVTRYTVAINFTKIIGFSSSYVDTSVPLEKGYYLVKSYYAKQDNSATMADSFNPVYSYLYSDGNENYKLIKQNIAYAGLTSSSGITLENTKDNYYNRLMSFIPIQLFYEISVSDMKLDSGNKQVGYTCFKKDDWTMYTYTLNETRVNDSLSFKAFIKAMNKDVNFNISLDLDNAKYIGEVLEDDERPAPYVPVFSSSSSSKYTLKVGTIFPIPKVMACLGDEICDIKTTAWYNRNLVEIKDGKLILENIGTYELVFKASSPSYKTSLNNDTFSELKIVIESTNSGNEIVRVEDINNVLPLNTNIIAGSLDSSALEYNEAKKCIAKIADNFQVFSIELVDDNGNQISIEDSLLLSFRVDDYFDRTKVEVYYMDDNGLKLINCDNYGRYISIESLNTGIYIVCVPGVAFVMPMWGYVLILCGCLIVIALLITTIIILVKKKNKRDKNLLGAVEQ